MDTGINMLGQFQGDSSLGLGSFQGNSYPSLEISSLEDRSLSNPFEQDAKISGQGLRVSHVGYFYKISEKSEKEHQEIEDRLHTILCHLHDIREIHPGFDDLMWKRRVDFMTHTGFDIGEEIKQETVQNELSTGGRFSGFIIAGDFERMSQASRADFF